MDAADFLEASDAVRVEYAVEAAGTVEAVDAMEFGRASVCLSELSSDASVTN